MLRRPGNLGESEHRHRGALSDPPAVTSSYLEVRDEGPYASGSMPLQGGNGSYTLMAGETFRSLSGGYGGSSTYGSSDHYGYEGVAGGSQRSSSSRDTHSFSYTGFQMPSPADESRYRIDSQIGHWLEQIRGLCESRNRLSPIYKLPNEILSYIFCYCMPSSKDNAHAPSSYMFLEVCRHWRAVGLGTAALWAVILPRTLASLDMTQAYLLRSKRMPLTLSLRSNSPLVRFSPAAVAFVLSNMDRIARLRLHNSCRGFELASLSLPAPCLISCTVASDTHFIERLPENFLGLCAPQLRHLHLRHTSLNWTAARRSLLHGLVNLSLQELNEEFSRESLIDVLKASTSLQRLTLRVLSFRTPGGEEHRDPSMLAQLTTLYVDDEGSCVCNLLECIRIPPAASVTLRFRSQVPQGIRPLVTFLQNHSSCRDDRTHIQRLECYETSDGFAIRAYRTPNSNQTNPSLLHLIFPRHQIDSFLRDINFIDKLHLDHLEVLGLRVSSTKYERVPVTDILKRCQNASELWLRSNGATKTVLPLLVESSPKRNPLSVKPILLPAVRRIRFNFEQRRPSQDLLSRMRNLLTRRHKLTNGTLAYTLFNGSLRYPELEKLRQVAGGVELVEELYGAGAPSDGELDLGHEQESDDE